MAKEKIQPLGAGEYARLVELGEENDWSVPAGRYLLTDRPGEVDTKAKLTLGLQTETEIVAHNEDTGQSLVKVNSSVDE